MHCEVAGRFSNRSACDLTFTTGGSGGSWGTQSGTPYPYYGSDMAESGSVGDDEQVWMQTSVTVSDGEKMSFYWKVSSEQGGDYLKFYINNVLQHQISGNVDWQKKSYTFSGSGTKTLKWSYVKNSSESEGEDKGWVDGLVIGSGSLIPPPDVYGEALDCDLKFTSTGTEASDTWSADSGTTVEYYLNGDSAKSYAIGANEQTCLQTIVESENAETIKFYWKVSSQSGGDYLQFYIDSTLKDQISGEVGWQQKSYPVDPGTHILKWRYVKNSSGTSGDDCAWVDFVQWTGPSPAQDPANWQQITYKHDVTGRRAEKKVDGYTTRYVRDGAGSVLAEYDGNNNLLRKYIAGPGGPVCMIEVADSNAVYYYHQDGRGSIVALSDANGDTVQTYEYSVFGEVAVEDANHPNPYMFGGMRFEVETGLYYLGGPVYNPYIGRMLQQNFGIHWERYSWDARSANNSSGLTDPFAFESEEEEKLNDSSKKPPDISICSTEEATFANSYGKRITPKHVYLYTTGKDILDILEKITKEYGAIGTVYFFGHGWGHETEQMQNNPWDGGIPGANRVERPNSGFYGTKPSGADKDARDLSDLQDLMGKGRIKFAEGKKIFIEHCRVGSTGNFANRLADLTLRPVTASWGGASEFSLTRTSVTFRSRHGPEAEKNDPYNGWTTHYPKETGGTINRIRWEGEFVEISRGGAISFPLD